MFDSAEWKAGSLPPILLPLLYLAFSTLCFALALTATIFYAQDLTGFYYHPHILALTHLITLGWISGNILGLIYLVGPMSLQIYLPARTYDWIAFSFYSIGVSGMVAHFWRDLPVGMAWSAACAYIGVLLVAMKVLVSIFRSKAPGFVKMHVFLAFANFLIAGLWGVMIGIHKVKGFLPTSTSPNVIAHAHLAAIGWAAMIVFGISYRLLPMFLPAEPVKGRLPWISGVFLEVGVLSFFVSTLMQLQIRWLSGAFIVIGILLFFRSAMWIASKRKTAPPPEIPRPDFSLLHAPVAFLCLFACCIAGPVLLFVPANEKTLQWTLAYACLGLVGFFGQLIVGLKPKILSILVWYHVFARNRSVPQRPVDMPVRIFQITVFTLWAFALPLLIAGLAVAKGSLITEGATLLLASLVLSTIHECTILKIYFSKRLQRLPLARP